MTAPDVEALGRHDSWDGVRAVVAGFGVSGFAAADNLTHLGASVIALDETDDRRPGREGRAARDPRRRRPARRGRDGHAARRRRPRSSTSPGCQPDAPLLAAGPAPAASRSGARSSWPGGCATPTTPAPWLCVTGTNGKTTTVQMLDAILRAAGLRSVAVGNVGLPIVEAVMDPTPYDVLAVELSSFQLHYTDSMSAESAAVLNVAEDHLDWYAGPTGMADYAADKGRIYERVQRACVYNVADPETERLVREADVVEGARAIGFTLGHPGVGMLGVVDDILADRAFVDERATQRRRAVHDRRPGLARRPHFVANALAAAALARAHGVSPGRGPRRPARLPSRRPPDRDGRRVPTASPGSTTPRPPTRTPRSRRCRPTTRWCGSPAGWPRARRFDDLVRGRPRPAARRRAARPRPRA